MADIRAGSGRPLDNDPDSTPFQRALAAHLHGESPDTPLDADEQQLLNDLLPWLDALRVAAANADDDPHPARATSDVREAIRTGDPVALMLGLVPDPNIAVDGRKLAHARIRSVLDLQKLLDQLRERGWDVSTDEWTKWEHTQSVLPPALVSAIASSLGVEDAGLLTDLGQSIRHLDDDSADPSDSNVQDLIDVVSRDLPERHFGTTVGEVEKQRFAVDKDHALVACARVFYLDTSVIVAILAGPAPGPLIHSPSVAEACLRVVQCEPDAHAVAIAAHSQDWPTVVIQVPYMRMAFEPPGGAQKGPRMVMEALPVVDALSKYLDRQVTAWEATETVASLTGSTDVAALASRNAVAAVDQIASEGNRATTRAKKAAWTNLPAGTVERIAAAIIAIAAEDPLDAVLNRLTEPGRDGT